MAILYQSEGTISAQLSDTVLIFFDEIEPRIQNIIAVWERPKINCKKEARNADFIGSKME